jgi:hypothetical protein
MQKLNLGISVLWDYTLSLVRPGGDVYADVQLSVRVKAFYSITLVMNVICTCDMCMCHYTPGR